MGQKVDPRGLRLGITRSWDSNWYADKKEYAKYFHEDMKVREFVKKAYYHAGVSKVKLERTSPVFYGNPLDTGIPKIVYYILLWYK